MSVALALLLVVVAIVLLSIERIPIEISSLAIVVLLALSGLVEPQEALAGFSSETAIFIFALLAMTQGLGATGVMQIIGRRLLRLTRGRPYVFAIVLLVTVCLFSSVASNTAVTAAFLPVVLASSAQAGLPPSRVLMPMAFGSMLGGMIFLYGTSTNLVVSAAMARSGLAPLGFAELTPVGLPLAALGLAVTLLLVRRLPVREPPHAASTKGRREYVTEARLVPGSWLVGQPVRALTLGLGIPVRAVVRRGVTLPPDAYERLTPEDRVIVAGSLDAILLVKDLQSLELEEEFRRTQEPPEPYALAELLVPPASDLEGRSVREVRFADRFGLVVLAIDRHPTVQAIRSRMNLLGSLSSGELLRHQPLSAGDMLLVSGPERRLRDLAQSGELTVVGGVQYERPRYRRAALALAIFAAAISVSALGWLSPAIAGLCGMLLMVATRCVDARTAFRVDWRVVILIGALLTLGLGMERSGAGEFLARGVVPIAQVLGPRGVLFALMLGTLVLSVPMSNQAAALVMLPVGINAALQLGLDPRTFAVGTCLAASCSFMTPLEPSAALVFGPGHYRFTDFLKVGTPLTALMLALLTFAVPVVWPFRPV